MAAELFLSRKECACGRQYP